MSKNNESFSRTLNVDNQITSKKQIHDHYYIHGGAISCYNRKVSNLIIALKRNFTSYLSSSLNQYCK